jgi:serine/threonine-protein kinase
MEVALAHQYQSLPPLPPTVPLPVAALVAELTARDPAVRPASASEVAARAGRLRDAVGGAAATQDPWLVSPAAQAGAGAAGTRSGMLPSGEPGFPGDMPGEEPAATLRVVGLHGAGMPGDGVYGAGAYDPATYGAGIDGPGWPPSRRHRPRPARGRGAMLLAAAAIAVIVSLAGWVLASASGGAPPTPSAQRHPAARHSSRPTTAVAGRTVDVNADALTGQPVSTVVRQLRQLGLRVHVMSASSDQTPGTVLSVEPGGKVPVGTMVDVTAAAQPSDGGQSHHHHGGDGGGH